MLDEPLATVHFHGGSVGDYSVYHTHAMIVESLNPAMGAIFALSNSPFCPDYIT